MTQKSGADEIFLINQEGGDLVLAPRYSFHDQKTVSKYKLWKDANQKIDRFVMTLRGSPS